MRQARHVDFDPLRNAPSGREDASCPAADRPSCPFAPRPSPQAASSPATGIAGPLGDWIDTQANVLGLWLDRLIEQGDPGDVISMVHRQQAWLELMKGRLQQG